MSRFVLTVPKVKRAVRLVVREGWSPEPITFNGSREVREYFETIREWAREAFVAFFLDTKNGLLQAELISIGTVDSAAVYPREVVRAALEAGAASVVFAHNHPTGDPEPSLCDREVTRDLVAACGLLRIKVLDHVILGSPGRAWSFSDRGLIGEYRRAYQDDYRGLGEPRAWSTP